MNHNTDTQERPLQSGANDERLAKVIEFPKRRIVRWKAPSADANETLKRLLSLALRILD